MPRFTRMSHGNPAVTANFFSSKRNKKSYSTPRIQIPIGYSHAQGYRSDPIVVACLGAATSLPIGAFPPVRDFFWLERADSNLSQDVNEATSLGVAASRLFLTLCNAALRFSFRRSSSLARQFALSSGLLSPDSRHVLMLPLSLARCLVATSTWAAQPPLASPSQSIIPTAACFLPARTRSIRSSPSVVCHRSDLRALFFRCRRRRCRRRLGRRPHSRGQAGRI